MVVIQQTQSAIMNPPAARAARAHTRPMIMKRTLPPPDPTRQPIARTMPSDRTIPEIKEQQRSVTILSQYSCLDMRPLTENHSGMLVRLKLCGVLPVLPVLLPFWAFCAGGWLCVWLWLPAVCTSFDRARHF